MTPRRRRSKVACLAAVLAVLASVVTVVPAQGTAAVASVPLAWGSNDRSQLGPNGPKPFTATPVEVPGVGDVTQLAAGLGHSLALRADGTVWAWGRNAENELGDGQSVYTTDRGWTTQPGKDPSIPDPSPDRAQPGLVYQRTETPKIPPGTGTLFDSTTTVTPPVPMTDVKAVAAGWYHSLAVKNDGTVWAWGENACAELGNGKTFSTAGAGLSPPAAVQVPGLSGVVAVAAGRGHSLALDKNGVLWAWGDTRWGQAGNGTSRLPSQITCFMPDGTPGGLAQLVPAKVSLLLPVVAFAAGSDHSLAVTSDGTVWSWGANCSGQLGSSPDAGVTGVRSVPSPVLGVPAAKAVGAGGPVLGGQSMMVTADGQVYAWGLADVLGSGTVTGTDSPCRADPRFTSGGNTDALGYAGQQGRLTPAAVVDASAGATLTGVTAVDGGVYHSLAVKGDGAVVAWGHNDVGQLGPIATAGQTALSAVKALDGPVASVSAGSHSLALPGPASSTTTTTIPLPTTTTLTIPTPTTTTLPTTTSITLPVPTLPTTTSITVPVPTLPTTTSITLPVPTTVPPLPTTTIDLPVSTTVPPLPVTTTTIDLPVSTTVPPLPVTTTTITLPVSTTIPPVPTLTTTTTIPPVPTLTTTTTIPLPVSTTLPVTTTTIDLPVSTTIPPLPVTTTTIDLPVPTSTSLPLPTSSTTTTITSSTTATSSTTTTTAAPTTTTTTPPTTSTTTPPKPPSRDRVIQWERTNPLGGDLRGAPDARHASATAYDEARQETILFGGTATPASSPTFGDTWSWDGTAWVPLPVSGPDPRYGHAMAYDAAHRQVVLFGGRDHNGAALGDTWTWDGSRWTKVATTGGPSPRSFMSMAYDSDRSQVVLFGGEDAGGVALADTWAWNGSVWTQLQPATSPPARGRAAMAYNPSTHSALLFGGWNGGRVALGDTWSWDGASWRQENTGPYPEAREGHAMAYHPATKQIVLFGGSPDLSANPPCCPQTWTWDGDDWGTAPLPAVDGVAVGEPVDVAGIARPGVAPTMGLDALGRLVLFGGLTWAGDTNGTWLFVVATQGTTPVTLPQPPPPVCATREASAPPPPSTTTTTTAPSSTTTTTQPAGTTVSATGAWKREGPLTSPSAREGAAMAYDPLNKETILFGGFDRNAQPCVHGETWAWNGSTWTLKSPATSPPARYGQTMAYDAEHKQVVLFGGSDGSNDLGDTWVWDGSTWAPRQTGAAPSPRARQTMAYDTARKQVVLFGGDHLATPLGDTWAWDGSAWIQLHPLTAPPARGYATMTYDAARADTVLVGGWDGTARADVWIWDGSNWRAAAAAPGTVDSGAMAFDPSGKEVVLRWGATGGFGRTGNPSGAPCHDCTDTLRWDGATWVRSTAGSFSPDTRGAAPSPRMFAAMAQDATGGLVFFGGFGQDLSTGVDTTLPDTDQADTWTYRTGTDGAGAPVGPGDVYGKVEVTLVPSEIEPDGTSTAAATARVTKAGVGVPGRQLSFSTDGDVTFSAVTDKGDGTYSATITASRTADVETITATDNTPDQNFYSPNGPKSGSARLVERGVAVKLDPPSIQADGSSTSRATATVVTSASASDQTVAFSTDGDVTFAPVTKNADGTFTTTITASVTPGPETITATASPSGLHGSAVLTEAGNGWFDRTPPAGTPSPPARDESAMAFDATRNQTVLFGGYNGDRDNPFGDTWTWDGTQWTERHPATNPPARYGHALAYDAAREQVVLFGGFGRNGYLGDTWTWDGTTWTEHQVAGPSARYRHAMAYDAARTDVVLFGGWVGADCDTNTHECPAKGDTWIWDGAAWTERTPTSTPPPPPDTGPKEFSNGASIVLPLPGPPPGCPGIKCPPDQANPYPSTVDVSGMTGKVAKVTVTLKDLSWTQSGPADAEIMLVAPGGKAVMVMSDACGTPGAANPIPRDHPVTLTFDDNAAAGLSATGPCSSGTYKPTNVTTPECTPWHSPDFFPPPAPPGTSSTSFSDFQGLDANGRWSLYVVDDCPNDTNPAGEAGRIDKGWALDIATSAAAVTPVAAPPSPPARGWAAMGFHPGSGKVVLYGGSQVYVPCATNHGAFTTCGTPFNPLADTWTWDGAGWAQEGGGTSPGLRHSASLAVQPATGQLVLFGGSDGRGGDVADRALSDTANRVDTAKADTWTWDGTTWAPQASTAAPPPARHSAALAQGPAGDLVLFSGFHPVGKSAQHPGIDYTYLGDTWTYDSRVSARLDNVALPADGGSKTTVVATVVDGAGKGVPGLAVTFASSGDVRVSGTVDRGDGTYAATVTASATDGFETITATTPRGSAATTIEEVRAAACSARSGAAPGSWSAVAPMPSPRWRMAAASGRDGRVYVFGGSPDQTLTDAYGNTVDQYLATVESYDPCTNSWQALPPMPGGARAGATAAVGSDGRIYVSGGLFYTTRRVEVYTPGLGSTRGRWETLPAMPSTHVFAASTVADDGRLYVMGGLGDNGLCAALSSVNVYTPGPGGGIGRWDVVPDLTRGRFSYAAATLPGGRLLAMGGGDGNCQGQITVEGHDQGTDGWTLAAPMANPRVFFAAVVADGQVYALGGAASAASYSSGTNPATNTVETYVPCMQAWAPSPAMPRVRLDHAAARGGDGRIYVLGGFTKSSDAGALGDTALVDAYAPDPTVAANACPKVSIDDVTVIEPSSGSSSVRFTVSLDHPPAQSVRVAYQTQDGTAKDGSDYSATSGTLQFGTDTTTTLPGVGTAPPDPSQSGLSRTISVTVLGDSTAEPAETFTVKLTLLTSGSATMAKDTGVGTIQDSPPTGSTTSTSTTTTVATTSTTTTTALPGVSLPGIPTTSSSLPIPSTSSPLPTLPVVTTIALPTTTIPDIPVTTIAPPATTIPDIPVTIIALPTTTIPDIPVTTIAPPATTIPDIAVPITPPTTPSVPETPPTTLPDLPISPPTGTTIPIPEVTAPSTTVPTTPDITGLPSLPTLPPTTSLTTPDASLPSLPSVPTTSVTTPGVTVTSIKPLALPDLPSTIPPTTTTGTIPSPPVLTPVVVPLPPPPPPVNPGPIAGPPNVGGTPDLGAIGNVGGAPDLGGIGNVGGAPDLGGIGNVGGAPDLGGIGNVGGAPDLGGIGNVGGAPGNSPTPTPAGTDPAGGSPATGGTNSGSPAPTAGTDPAGGSPATGGSNSGSPAPNAGTDPTGGSPATGGTNSGSPAPSAGADPAGGSPATGGSTSGSPAPSAGADPAGGSPATGGSNSGSPAPSAGADPAGGSPATGGSNSGSPAPSAGADPAGGSPATGGSTSGSPAGSAGNQPGGSSPAASPSGGSNAGAEAGSTPAPPQGSSSGSGAVQGAPPPPPQGSSSGSGAGQGGTPPPPPQGSSAHGGDAQGVVAPGAVAEPERDPELAPQVETVSESEPYLASGRRPEPVPPAAMVWGAALAAAGLGWGLRRRGSRRPTPAPAWARARTRRRR